MNLYFIRHGKTLYNEQDIFQGLADSPLLEESLKTSERIGQYLRRKNIDVIYSSPLKRAKRTSEIINRYLKRNIIYDNRLTEICYGDFEEKKKRDLKKLEIWRRREKNKFEFIHPGEYKGITGQSYKEKLETLKDFFQELLGQKKNILVVGHLGTCRAARAYFNRDIKEEMAHIKHENNEIYHIEYISKKEFNDKTIKL